MPKLKLSIDYDTTARRKSEPIRMYVLNRGKSDPEFELEVLIQTIVGIMRQVDDIDPEDIEDEDGVPSKYKIQGVVFDYVKSRLEELYFSTDRNFVATYIMEQV